MTRACRMYPERRILPARRRHRCCVRNTSVFYKRLGSFQSSFVKALRVVCLLVVLTPGHLLVGVHAQARTAPERCLLDVQKNSMDYVVAGLVKMYASLFFFHLFWFYRLALHSPYHPLFLSHTVCIIFSQARAVLRGRRLHHAIHQPRRRLQIQLNDARKRNASRKRTVSSRRLHRTCTRRTTHA